MDSWVLSSCVVRSWLVAQVEDPKRELPSESQENLEGGREIGVKSVGEKALMLGSCSDEPARSR